jgi:hypothetical protein
MLDGSGTFSAAAIRVLILIVAPQQVSLFDPTTEQRL